MNNSTTSKNIQTISRYLFGGIMLSILVLGSLYAFEAVPARFATSEAGAWGCSLSATPTTVTKGQSVTLTWDSANDVEYITIDQLGDQQFDRDGSTTVTPTETTTYVVRTHVDFTTDTMSCSKKVTVTEPADSCDKVDLSIDGKSFTWAGPPALSHYTVEYCDGTKAPKVDTNNATDKMTLTMDRAIKKVSAKGGQCQKEVTATCVTKPVEPSVPVCPLTQTATRTVVDFNGGKDRASANMLLSNNASKTEIVRPVSLAPGTYTVETVSWDGYSSRTTVSQKYEQWNVEARNANGVLAFVGPTTDIADNVLEDTKRDTYTDALVITAAATKVAAKHAYPNDTSSPNSVIPICVSFERKADPQPEPCTCELTANPSKITKGGNSTLTLKSTNAVSAVIDQGVGNVTTNTGISVIPTQTTKYTATITGKGGEKVTCDTTVVVEEPNPEWPACPLTEGVVVNFNGKGLRSNGTESEATSDVYPVLLSAGTYTIKSASWDGYATRVNTTQPNEQWKLILKKDGGIEHTTGATTDLADYVAYSLVTDTLENALNLSKGVDQFYAYHAVYPDKTSPNSVQPICVSFVRHADPTPDPEPVCDISASPLLIDPGASSTITWSSTNADTVSWNGTLSATDLNGSIVVNPTAQTTYTGTFTGKNGKTDICSVTVDIKQPTEDPWCDMNVSQNSVTRGSSVTLTWDSFKMKDVSIDQGIGSVGTSGSKAVTVNANTTYTGTFTDVNGDTKTCAASVTIKTGGGGGSCLNCGDDDDDDDDEPRGGGGGGGGGGGSPDPSPTIILSKTVTNPGGYITLDQVPYTGFEAGPVMTAVFWLGVLLVSAALAYVVTMVQPIARFQALHAVRHEQDIERSRIMHMSAVATATRSTVFSTAPAHGHTIGDPADAGAFVENVAHRENILLSPEALRAIIVEVERQGAERSAFLTDFFNKAKGEYAREDGWILLSKERTMNLLGSESPAQTENPPLVSTTEAPVRVERNAVAYNEQNGERERAQGAPAAQKAQTNTNAQASRAPEQATQRVAAPTHSFTKAAPVSVGTFVGWLVAAEEQKTFEYLRTAASQSNGVELFIGQVVRALDDVYKHRLEGNHNPDAELARLTATWSNGDFERVLGILVECIDFSYSNNRIGSKVALAKAFEYFRSK